MKITATVGLFLLISCVTWAGTGLAADGQERGKGDAAGAVPNSFSVVRKATPQARKEKPEDAVDLEKELISEPEAPPVPVPSKQEGEDSKEDGTRK